MHYLIVYWLSGVSFQESVRTQSANPVIYAGFGTITVATGMSVVTTNQPLVLTADDIDLQGTAALSAGNANIRLTTTTGGNDIGIGVNDQHLNIQDAEMGVIHAEQGFAIGDVLSGHIVVAGMTDANTDAVGTITLVATKPLKEVSFVTSNSAFNKGIVVQAMGGVVLSESVSTKNWPTLIYAGTGTLTTLATKSLSSTNQLLTVTADDVDLQGDLVDSGTAMAIITTLTVGNTIGIGLTGQLTFLPDMDIENSELDDFQTSGVFKAPHFLTHRVLVQLLHSVHSIDS